MRRLFFYSAEECDFLRKYACSLRLRAILGASSEKKIRACSIFEENRASALRKIDEVSPSAYRSRRSLVSLYFFFFYEEAEPIPSLLVNNSEFLYDPELATTIVPSRGVIINENNNIC